MSEFDDALKALDDAIYLFTKPGGGHTDTGKRLIAAKAEFKACRQALVTATLEQSGAIFQVQKLQAELLNHRHSGGDGEAVRIELGEHGLLVNVEIIGNATIHASRQDQIQNVSLTPRDDRAGERG